MVLKCTKNRFNGRTDTWLMNIDYEHMRFSDMLTAEQMSVLVNDLASEGDLDDDFGLIPQNVATGEKLKHAEEYANTEVKDIMRESAIGLFENESVESQGRSLSEVEEIYKELGIS